MENGWGMLFYALLLYELVAECGEIDADGNCFLQGRVYGEVNQLNQIKSHTCLFPVIVGGMECGGGRMWRTQMRLLFISKSVRVTPHHS